MVRIYVSTAYPLGARLSCVRFLGSRAEERQKEVL
jgi:hypothetical protein